MLGDYLPTKLKMDAGENVIFMVLPGVDYAGSLLFFYENGKVARIEMKAYQTASNRRKLTGAYSDKSPLACIRRLDEDCELAVYSNEPRCLIFHTALLAPKTTRSAQGVAVMTLKPKYHLETVLLSEETSITNRTRYRVRAIPAAGALVRRGFRGSADQPAVRHSFFMWRLSTVVPSNFGQNCPKLGHLPRNSLAVSAPGSASAVSRRRFGQRRGFRGSADQPAVRPCSGRIDKDREKSI